MQPGASFPEQGSGQQNPTADPSSPEPAETDYPDMPDAESETETETENENENDRNNNALADKPLFVNSIVSTEIDFITADDPSSFSKLIYKGQENSEMPDSRAGKNELFDKNTFVFEAQFSDGAKVGIYAHSSFGSKVTAEAYAMKVTGPLGKLPELMRGKLSHVNIHNGDHTAFGESEGHFFVLYSENMDTRIRNHDLEETVFHESVHATLDQKHAQKTEWKNAQTYDGIFITEYGESKPNLEDFAESAIFAYTMKQHPGRLPFEVEDWISLNTPNRLSYFATVFP